MRRGWHIAALMFLCLSTGRAALGQSEVKKIEVAGQFTFINLVDEGRNDPGFGGRLTYNVNDYLALEAELNFFPRVERRVGGRVTQGLFGVKAGKRFERFGVFAKARPGFVSFGRELTDVRGTFPDLEPVFDRVTRFAMDIGGAVEYYPSPRTLVRIDIGDTIVRYGSETQEVLGVPFIFPARTRHNFQLSVGFGFRF